MKEFVFVSGEAFTNTDYLHDAVTIIVPQALSAGTAALRVQRLHNGSYYTATDQNGNAIEIKTGLGPGFFVLNPEKFLRLGEVRLIAVNSSGSPVAQGTDSKKVLVGDRAWR